MKGTCITGIIVCATTCFALGYALIYVCAGLSALYFAYDFDVYAVLFFDHLWIDSIPASSKFSQDAISAILLSQPVCSFVIGLVLLFIYRRIKKNYPIILTFSIYLMLISFCNCFALIIYNLFFESELSELLSWMGVRFVVSLIALFFPIFFLIKTGQSVAVFFLSNSSERLQKRLLLFYFVVPCVIGNILIISIRYAHDPILMGIIFPILNAVILVPMFFTVIEKQTKTIALEKLTLWNLLLILAATVGLILMMYFCLCDGFSFSEDIDMMMY